MYGNKNGFLFNKKVITEPFNRAVLNKLYVAILFFGTKKGRFRVIICVLCLFKFLKY